MDTHVVVVGLGTSGSMALWQLAKRGVKAIGVEQFGVGHSRGSYAGDSRLFRSTVHEGTRYVPLLQRARQLWRELEAETGRHLYDECGALQIGQAGSGSLANSLACAEKYGLPYELRDADALRARYPQHRVDDDDAAVLDVHAGSLYPEASVFAAVEAAKSHGAQVVTNTEVLDFDEEGGRLKLVTSGEPIICDKVVVATGSWTMRLRPDLRGYLHVLPFALTWFMPHHPELFTPDRFPVFIRDSDGVHLYGTPTHDSYSVKVASDPQWAAIADPDEIPVFERTELRRIGAWAAKYLPDLNPEPVRHSMHHDLCAPCDFPIIDLDEDSGMVLLTAFSGRGFKFAPVYGELAADLITGERNDLYDPGFALSGHNR